MSGYRYIIILLLIFSTLPIAAQPIQTQVRKYSLVQPGLPPAPSPLDTALTRSFLHHPLNEKDLFWSDLGNTSSPAVSIRFQGIHTGLSQLLSAYDPYVRRDDSISWLDTQTPFSLINYNSGGANDKNGQTIKALYSRNMARDHNLTALIRYYKSDGHYQKQGASSNAAVVNYVILKDHYKLFAGVRNHSFNLQENGGLRNDEDLISSFGSAYLPVRLADAASKASITSVKGGQYFDLTRWPVKDRQDTTGASSYRKILPVKIEHNFSFASVYRTYKDQNPGSGFYQNIWLDSNATNDSLRITSITNRIEAVADTLPFGSLPVRLSAGLQPVWQRFYSDSSMQSVFGLDLVGSIAFGFGRNPLRVDAFFNPLGYYRGDLGFSAAYRQFSKRDSSSFVEISLDIHAKRPDPFILSFSSNHFKWENDFQKQRQLSLTGKWNWNAIRSMLTGKVFLISHLVVFGAEAVPVQLADPAIILVFEAKKRLSTGPFHTDVTMLIQKSSSDQVPLPLFATQTEVYMHHDLRFKKTEGLLELDYGFEVRYWTNYQGYAYMPATGVFYTQNDRALGNYPILDFFAQVKIKRTRIFVQWNHTLGPFFREAYFSTLHYPYPDPHLKYGIYWHFYD